MSRTEQLPVFMLQSVLVRSGAFFFKKFFQRVGFYATNNIKHTITYKRYVSFYLSVLKYPFNLHDFISYTILKRYVVF